MLNLYGRPDRSRGILPLIAAALVSGAVRTGVGAIQANQRKQRNKGYINAAYRTSKQELDTNQGEARQGIAESLNARGLANQGTVSASPIHTAMVGERMTADGSPTTIGGQVQSDSNVQMGLEQQDLEQKHDRALKENKGEYNEALLNAGVSGVNTAMSVYSGGKDLGLGGGGGAAAGATASRSGIHDAMLSGVGYDNVNPVNPLGSRTSAWSTNPRTINAQAGQSNDTFNVG